MKNQMSTYKRSFPGFLQSGTVMTVRIVSGSWTYLGHVLFYDHDDDDDGDDDDDNDDDDDDVGRTWVMFYIMMMMTIMATMMTMMMIINMVSGSWTVDVPGS